MEQKQRKWWAYILIFFISQFLAIALPFGLRAVGISLSANMFLSMGLMVANLLAIGLFLLYCPAEVTWASTLSGLRDRNLRRSALVFLTAIPVCLLVNLIQEAFFPDIPDLVGDEAFKNIMYNPLGLLTVALIGPLSEELLFRGGVQTCIHRKYATQGPAAAIGFSAVLFSLIHLNPAQMPVAFILGLLLGFAYWWTGSLAAPVCIHAFNNSFACLLAYLSPDDDSLINFLGGNEGATIAAVVSVFALVLLFRQIRAEEHPKEM